MIEQCVISWSLIFFSTRRTYNDWSSFTEYVSTCYSFFPLRKVTLEQPIYAQQVSFILRASFKTTTYSSLRYMYTYTYVHIYMYIHPVNSLNKQFRLNVGHFLIQKLINLSDYRTKIHEQLFTDTPYYLQYPCRHYSRGFLLISYFVVELCLKYYNSKFSLKLMKCRVTKVNCSQWLLNQTSCSLQNIVCNNVCTVNKGACGTVYIAQQ
jgi:hypothetical protein